MVAETKSGGEARIWMALLAIIVLFTAVIMYARHVNIARQEDQAELPIVAHYTNYAYAVSLRYPPEWQPVGGQQYDRYEGTDGFFAVGAGGGASTTILELVNKEKINAVKAYGSDPSVVKLFVDGQDARLIMPSADQSPNMHGQAVLIARYPKLVTVGADTFYYLVFWADRVNIQDIASSITFLNK